MTRTLANKRAGRLEVTGPGRPPAGLRRSERQSRKLDVLSDYRWIPALMGISIAAVSCDDAPRSIDESASGAQAHVASSGRKSSEDHKTATPLECGLEETGDCVRLFGERAVPGQCVRGWCVTKGPGCIRDRDCHIEDTCTRSFCDDGTCRSSPEDGECALDEQSGRCHLGICEPEYVTSPGSCSLPDAGVVADGGVLDGGSKEASAELVDADIIGGCPAPENPCLEVMCSAEGTCRYPMAADGVACKTKLGGRGQCLSGRCALDEQVALSPVKTCKTIKRKRYNYYTGRVERFSRDKCRSSLRYRLSDEELNEQRKKLIESIRKGVHYDMAAGMVALPDGGYNLILVNSKSRREVRGLVDPSFVAFEVAGFTFKTKWKSAGLQVWLDGLSEGWGLPTSGSRKAIRKGQRASKLGFFGVVEVSTYRKWLEKSFTPLEPSPVLQGVIKRPQVSTNQPAEDTKELVP